MVLLTLHSWGFWALWIWQGEPARSVGWQPQGTNMLAGAISWLCGAALWVTATSYVRRNYFEVWRLNPACEGVARRAWCNSPAAIVVDTSTELLMRAGVLPNPHSGLSGIHHFWLHAQDQPLGFCHTRSGNSSKQCPVLSLRACNACDLVTVSCVPALFLSMLLKCCVQILKRLCVCAALALYLLDITFRVAQQAYPVRLQMTSVDSTGQLAQLHIGTDSFTPLHPIQVSSLLLRSWQRTLITSR